MCSVCLDRQCARRNFRRRECAAAYTRLTGHHFGVDAARAKSLSDRMRARLDFLQPLGEHGQHRNLFQRLLRIEVNAQRRFECSKSELVHAHRPGERILAQFRHERRLAQNDPGLWAAKELVAAHEDERGAGGDCRRCGRLAPDTVLVERKH